MNTYIHGTNELVLDLWKQKGIPSETYFGLLESTKGKKGIKKGVNPVIDASTRNTRPDRGEIFDKIWEVYEKLGLPIPEDALEKYETPVVIYVKGNGEFKQDPRGIEYIFLSPNLSETEISVLKLEPESSYRERAKVIDETDFNELEKIIVR